MPFIPFNPQPPAKYTEEFIERGWLWSKSTSGEGYEQQDLWMLPTKPCNAELKNENGIWGWEIISEDYITTRIKEEMEKLLKCIRRINYD